MNPSRGAKTASAAAGFALSEGFMINLLALVPLCAWPRGASLEGHHLPREALLCALGALAAIVRVVRRTRMDSLDVALGCFALGGLLSVAGSVDPWLGLRIGVLSVAVVALLGVARESAASSRTVALGAVCALLGAWAVLESLGPVPGFETGPGRAPAGPVATRNELGHVLAIGLGPLLTARPLRPLHRVLQVVSLACVGAGLVVTRSRAAWLAALAVMLVVAVAGLVARERRAALPWFVAALAALGCAALPTRLAWTSAAPYADTLTHLVDARTGSGHGRVVQATTSLRLVPDAPLLGVGPGHWAVHYPRVADPDDPTIDRDALEPANRLLTNDLVATLVERGGLGLALLLVVLALLVRAVLAQPDRAQKVGQLAALSAVGLLAALDSVLAVAATLAPIVLALAPPRLGPVPRAPSRLVHAACGALLVAAFCMRAVDLRAFALRTGQTTSLTDLENAARASPFDYPSRAQLGDALVLAGRCPDALPWLAQAVRLRPFVPVTRDALEACRRATHDP